MKPILITLSLATALSLPFAAMAQDDHAAHHPDDKAAAKEDAGSGMMMMDRQMQKMRDLMEKMHKASDPAERQRLLEEHMQAMHEGMETMRGMRGEMGMMGKRKDAAKDGEGRAQDDSADGGHMMMGMLKRHKMMQQRMDMMESMMEQMLEHEAMERKLEAR
jgi:hypothetical protein